MTEGWHFLEASLNRAFAECCERERVALSRGELDSSEAHNFAPAGSNPAPATIVSHDYPYTVREVPKGARMKALL